MAYDLHNKQLPFPLNYLPSDGGAVTADFAANNLAGTLATSNWYVVCLTGQEMIDLQSVIAVGAPIAFEETFMSMVQFYMQVAEYPNEIPEGSCMELCALIIDCIETTPSLQTLIQSTVNGTPDTGGIESRYTSDAFDVDDCDEDQMYGSAFALWEYIHANNVDALEIIAEGTNASEQLSKVLTAVLPGLELLPVDEILGWIESFGNYNLEAYNASVTTELEQAIICDLFCIAVNGDCGLNFEDVYDYFIDKMGGTSIPTITATLAEWIAFMVLGSYANDRIVYLWSAFQLALAFMGQEFLGLSTLARYALVGQAGDPDDDWTLFCLDCVSWEQVFDFTSSQYGFTVVANRGVYSAGNGFRSYKFASNETALAFYWDNLDVNKIIEVICELSFTGYTGVSYISAMLATYDIAQSITTVETDYPANGFTNNSFNGNYENYGVRIYVPYATGFIGNPDPIWTMHTMTVRGTGINPFI